MTICDFRSRRLAAGTRTPTLSRMCWRVFSATCSLGHQVQRDPGPGYQFPRGQHLDHGAPCPAELALGEGPAEHRPHGHLVLRGAAYGNLAQHLCLEKSIAGAAACTKAA